MRDMHSLSLHATNLDHIDENLVASYIALLPPNYYATIFYCLHAVPFKGNGLLTYRRKARERWTMASTKQMSLTTNLAIIETI
jgi:hypothetical protein